MPLVHKVLKRVDCLIVNDSEARQLGQSSNLIKAAEQILQMGPRVLVIKKAEHGAQLFAEGKIFAIPAVPLTSLKDPTGAGDAFLGGFAGSLSRESIIDLSALKRAAVYGSVMASFCVESIGPERLRDVDSEAIDSRCATLKAMVGVSKSRCRMIWHRVAIVVLVVAGCGRSPSVQVQIANADDHAVLEYYLGLMAGGDPSELGLLTRQSNGYRINPARLGELRPGFDRLLEPYMRGSQLDWDSLLVFAASVYDQIQRLPDQLAELRDSALSNEVLTYDVHGPMTRYLRRIWVPRSALIAAVSQYNANGQRLVYPTGTAIMAHHFDDGALMESTVMYKRPEGYWEFGTYDQEGLRAAKTRPNPRALETPRQCVGCHLGQREFEPEKSFPRPATDGPRWRTPVVYRRPRSGYLRFFSRTSTSQ